ALFAAIGSPVYGGCPAETELHRQAHLPGATLIEGIVHIGCYISQTQSQCARTITRDELRALHGREQETVTDAILEPARMLKAQLPSHHADLAVVHEAAAHVELGHETRLLGSEKGDAVQ